MSNVLPSLAGYSTNTLTLLIADPLGRSLGPPRAGGRTASPCDEQPTLRAVTVTIRDAEPDDLAEVVAMIRALAEFERLTDEVVFDEREMARHLFGPDPAATVAIAEVDGAVAGMALWF